jgi:hypothetical protein
MASVLELNWQTASFVRQLEDQRKLEKILLVEWVCGTKEWLESVFSDIKSRMAMLEKLNGFGECRLNKDVTQVLRRKSKSGQSTLCSSNWRERGGQD